MDSRRQERGVTSPRSPKDSSVVRVDFGRTDRHLCHGCRAKLREAPGGEGLCPKCQAGADYFRAVQQILEALRA